MNNTILLVEDETRVRHAVHRMLEALGYAVIEAANGADAIRVLDEGEPRIDLVLSDVVMPVMTGLEFAREVQRRDPTMPLLLMSGFAQDALDRNGGVVPGVPLLEKPFTFEALAAAVERALPRGVTGPSPAAPQR